MTEKWTQLALGAWLIISPWLLGFYDVSLAKWSSVLVGAALVLINLWGMYGKGGGGAA